MTRKAGLIILPFLSGDGSSFLRGKERSRSEKRTDIGGNHRKAGLIILPFLSGDFCFSKNPLPYFKLLRDSEVFNMVIYRLVTK